MHYLAFGWLGLMAGIAGLMQAHYAQEVVPNALYGRELDVLAAVVLGGARLGGGRGTVLGVILGIVLVAVTQNGLNLLGISPYAFKMIIGAIILVAITLSSEGAERLIGAWRSPAPPGTRLMSSPSFSAGRPAGFKRFVSGEILGLLGFLAATVALFGIASDTFLSHSTFTSIAFQLPELGLLTLAMLMPIVSGGFNLAITFTANLSGLAMASILQAQGGVDAGLLAFGLGVAAALATGALVGGLMGVIIAYTGAHPILVSLSMMIFVRAWASS